MDGTFGHRLVVDGEDRSIFEANQRLVICLHDVGIELTEDRTDLGKSRSPEHCDTEDIRGKIFGDGIGLSSFDPSW